MALVDWNGSYRRVESSFEFAGGPSGHVGTAVTQQRGGNVYIMPTPGSTYRMDPDRDRPMKDRGVSLPKLKWLERPDP